MASLLERMQGSAPGPTTPPVRTTSLLERMQRAGDDQDGFREGSLAQIKAEIRCLSLLLRQEISTLS